VLLIALSRDYSVWNSDFQPKTPTKATLEYACPAKIDHAAATVDKYVCFSTTC
jgi:hypothetical protein